MNGYPTIIIAVKYIESWLNFAPINYRLLANSRLNEFLVIYLTILIDVTIRNNLIDIVWRAHCWLLLEVVVDAHLMVL